VEARQSEALGLSLRELVRGFTCVIIIDALRARRGGREPGGSSGTRSRTSKGGQRFGYEAPEEVVVFAIDAADVETLGEELSPPAAAAAEQVVKLVPREVGA
jgi:hypothetical protein